ncbi:MAG: PAS domain S-box protein [Bacteroidetes bacterium]|nr:PAS domain S-box protein [Bacteroidota bacterium]MBL6943074.1 PAS domain S-box protein [Bacteroidales bacterium]
MTKIAKNKKRILLVEDDGIIVTRLKSILQKFGYETVDVLAYGEDVIDQVNKELPDLVILDIRLSGEINGVEVAEQLKAKYDIPVIFITAFSDEKLLEQARLTEPYAYLIKPINERELYATIELVLFRHEVETKLKKSEEKYRLLATNTLDTIWTTDLEFNMTYVNNAIFNFLGYSPEEFLGMNPAVFTTPEGMKTIRHEAERLFSNYKEGEIGQVKFEVRQLKKDGTKIDVEITGNLLLDNAGQIIGFQGRSIDITERIQADNALLESEAKFKFLTDHTFEWEYWVDNNGKYLYISPACEKVSGYTATQFIENPDLFFEIIVPDFREKVQEHFDEAKGEIHFDHSLEFLITKPDGECRWIEHYCNPVFDKEGNHQGRRGVNRDITEFKKSHDLLIKLEHAITNSTDIVFMTNENRVFTFVNPRFTEVYGYEADELIGIRTPGILNSQQTTKKQHNIFWNKVLKNNKLIVQIVNKCKDGKLINIEASVNTLIDDSGKTIGYLAIQRDITKRIEAEKTRREAKAFLENVLNTTPSAVFSVDTKKRITSWNRMAETITGFSAKEAIGKYCDFLNSESCSHGCPLFDEEVKKPGIFKSCLIKAKDGTEVNTLKIFDLLRSRDGEIIGGIESFIDVTQQTKAEQIQKVILNIANATQFATDLKETMQIIQKELGLLMDTKNFFVALYDAETDSINLPYFEDEKDDIATFPAGKTLTGLVIKQGQSLLIDDAAAKKLEEEGKIEKVGFDSEIWLGVPLKMKGEITGAFVLQSYTNPNAYTESDKEVLEIISYQVSLSIERKKAEQELKDALVRATESDRLKTAFLQNISHEIRTPMNGILGFTSLLQEPGLTGEQRQEYIDIIEISGNRMLNTINDIMDISMVETGQVKLYLSLTNVNNELLNLYKFFRSEVEKKGMQFTYKTALPDKDVNINTDRDRFYAILSNLIKNAIKYSHKGSIDFGYEKKGEYIEFYVNDTGIGIPENRQKAVFERFVQADIEDVHVFEGSGLGLSICKAYVELLDGQIWLESVEGKGSKFYFTIPCSTDKKDVTTIDDEIVSVPEMAASSKKLSILIAEDEEIADAYLSIILKDVSRKILHAKTGLDTITIVRDNPTINLILMDIKMPIVSGYEATRQIRKFNKNVVIIAQTAYALEGDREKAIEAGCNDYISKPIDKDELMEMIGRLV